MKIDEVRDFLDNELDILSDITGMCFDIMDVRYKPDKQKIIQSLKLKVYDYDIQFQSDLSVASALAEFAGCIALSYILSYDYLYNMSKILYFTEYKAKTFIVGVIDNLDKYYDDCDDIDKSITMLIAEYKEKYSYLDDNKE